MILLIWRIFVRYVIGVRPKALLPPPPPECACCNGKALRHCLNQHCLSHHLAYCPDACKNPEFSVEELDMIAEYRRTVGPS